MCDLSVILLVWRDVAFLAPCLEALEKARGKLALEIILIQNGVSLDVPGATEADSLPLRVIRNSQNLGVAPARNQGLRAAQGRFCLLLDVDTVVQPNALANLVQFMDQHAQVGLAGPRLQDAQGNLQFTCRKLPTVGSKLLRRIPARWAQDALADEMLASYDHETARPVDYVIGACQLIRRTAMEQVGWLDGEFFYGPEDIDYCLRMWQHGWQVMYVPSAVVVHNEQRLTRQRTLSKLSLIHAAGLTRYFLKYRYAFTRPALGQPSGA